MKYGTKIKTLCLMIGMAATPLSFAHNHGGDKEMHQAHRSEANQQRDQYRQPYRTLDFFGIKASHKVVEILPGGGWYTEVLAPMLKDKGELVAAHYPTTSTGYRQRSRAGYEKKLADNNAVYDKVVLTEFDPKGNVSNAAKDADAVLVFRALHGLQNGKDLAASFSQFSQMLKQGGHLGIVQHQAPEGYDAVETAKKGYLPKSHVIAVAKAAGFELVSEAYFHNNPKDRILQDGIDGGVWTLPPSLNTETDKEKYQNIGESNRMTLLFSKR